MKTALLALVALGSVASAARSSTIIDFSKDAAGNTLAPLTAIAEQYASIGVHFVGSAFDEPDNPDDDFADNTDMRLTTAGGDVPPAAVIPAGAGNFLHTYSGWQAEDGDSNFAIVFDTPITSCSVDIYDDKQGLTQMFAIDGDDILDSAQSIETADAGPQTLNVSSADGFTVVGLILGSNQDWVGVDNVTFASVPEPAIVAGTSLTLLMGRRRRRAC